MEIKLRLTALAHQLEAGDEINYEEAALLVRVAADQIKQLETENKRPKRNEQGE